jgi:ABC-2 type transport system ATP-binding protein
MHVSDDSRSPDQGLIVEDLRVDYGAFTAVDGISFHVPPGEVFGLVGPNGAGKTSTIKVLATLLVPTYGSVKMFGSDILEDPDTVHRIVGYMPDLAPVVGDLRVWEFVDHFAGAYGWNAKTRSARVKECLELVGMWEARDNYGKSLSRGMTQRVVLAKTLLPNPQILLLDEPASGMDPIARIQLKEILQDISRKGSIVLISSHILTELSDMCTSVGIMHKGHMRYVGALEGIDQSISGNSLRTLLVEVLEGKESELEMFASNHELIDSVQKISGNMFEVKYMGDDRTQAEILKEMIEANLEILNFSRKSTLEAALKTLAES